MIKTLKTGVLYSLFGLLSINTPAKTYELLIENKTDKEFGYGMSFDNTEITDNVYVDDYFGDGFRVLGGSCNLGASMKALIKHEGRFEDGSFTVYLEDEEVNNKIDYVIVWDNNKDKLIKLTQKNSNLLAGRTSVIRTKNDNSNQNAGYFALMEFIYPADSKNKPSYEILIDSDFINKNNNIIRASIIIIPTPTSQNQIVSFKALRNFNASDIYIANSDHPKWDTTLQLTIINGKRNYIKGKDYSIELEGNGWEIGGQNEPDPHLKIIKSDEKENL